jgi:polyhydroxyalkanoate synthesis regulator phasin
MVRREELRSMTDAWRAYLDLALGLTETSRKRATKVAKKLVGKGGATAEQLQTMAEELVNTSVANREALTRLVRFELDRALGRVGLATAEEVGELTARVRELEQKLRAAQATAGPSAVDEPVAVPAVTPPPAKAVKKVAKKAVRPAVTAPPVPASAPAAPATPAAPAPAGPAKTATAASGGSATAAVAKETPAKKAPAKKAPAKKAVVKAAAKKAPAKKVTGQPVAKSTPRKAPAKQAGSAGGGPAGASA